MRRSPWFGPWVCVHCSGRCEHTDDVGTWCSTCPASGTHLWTLLRHPSATL